MTLWDMFKEDSAVYRQTIKKKRDDSGHNIGIYRGACEHLAALCGGIEIVLELV